LPELVTFLKKSDIWNKSVHMMQWDHVWIEIHDHFSQKWSFPTVAEEWWFLEKKMLDLEFNEHSAINCSRTIWFHHGAEKTFSGYCPRLISLLKQAWIGLCMLQMRNQDNFINLRRAPDYTWLLFGSLIFGPESSG
jgi:hypothetical protein